MLDEMITELIRLGLTEYEARTYAGLVGLGEGTARQVHEACGVPRPRVYDILETLERKGFVEVWQGKPKFYRAIPPDRLMRLLREDLEESMRKASAQLNELSFQAKQRSFPIWHIKGEMSIRDQVTNMLSDAKEEMMVICVRTSSLRPHIRSLQEISARADVLCIVPNDAESFQAVLPQARVVEPKWEKDPMAEFHQQLVKGKFGSFDEQYRVELLVIVDRLRSVLVYENGGERTGIVFELPLIVALQYSAIENLLLG